MTALLEDFDIDVEESSVELGTDEIVAPCESRWRSEAKAEARAPAG
jgi:hypothetical protein